MGDALKVEELAGIIEHTQLKPYEPEGSIVRLCDEALKYGFRAVCVSPFWVSLCRERLRGSNVNVVTVIGFPLGMSKPEVKAYEARLAVEDGADEVDMVMNLGAFKSGDYETVASDIRGVVSCGVPVKVILETCYLSREEIVRACRIAVEAGASFVKTSTGFGPAGARVEDVRVMKEAVAGRAGVKAAGGIRTFRDALRMVEAGADRIGTSSGVRIIEGYMGWLRRKEG